MTIWPWKPTVSNGWTVKRHESDGHIYRLVVQSSTLLSSLPRLQLSPPSRMHVALLGRRMSVSVGVKIRVGRSWWMFFWCELVSWVFIHPQQDPFCWICWIQSKRHQRVVRMDFHWENCRLGYDQCVCFIVYFQQAYWSIICWRVWHLWMLYIYVYRITMVVSNNERANGEISQEKSNIDIFDIEVSPKRVVSGSGTTCIISNRQMSNKHVVSFNCVVHSQDK